MNKLASAEITDLHQAEAETATQADKTQLGFWIYLMTDCILFGVLFATFVVLRNNTFGGPAGHQLFSLPFVLSETLILLTSSFTCGLAMLAVRRGKIWPVVIALKVTMLLGVAFLALEISEFAKLAGEGNSWQRSGFLSAFFTLVGTHGAHITVGLIWLASLAVRTFRIGITPTTTRQLTLASMFWHFLDVIWIFIFTIVYLTGAI